MIFGNIDRIQTEPRISDDKLTVEYHDKHCPNPNGEGCYHRTLYYDISYKCEYCLMCPGICNWRKAKRIK